MEYNISYNRSSHVGWTYIESQRPANNEEGTSSSAKTELETWYNNNIGNNSMYTSKIADGKYCNDRNVESGYTWGLIGATFNYAGNKRLYKDYAPTLSCPVGDVYILKVGLITADEVMYAGGKNTNNALYYLYNNQRYWTMTPSFWGGGAGMFFVDDDGNLALAEYVQKNRNSLRPVINLHSNVTFSDGNGTQSNPYVVT